MIDYSKQVYKTDGLSHSVKYHFAKIILEYLQKATLKLLPVCWQVYVVHNHHIIHAHGICLHLCPHVMDLLRLCSELIYIDCF